MSGSRYQVNAPSVISEVIDGVVIVLNFDNGHYYSLNGGGSRVWSGLASGRAVEELGATLAARHGLEPAATAATLAEFAGRLEAEGLIRRSTSPATAPVEAGADAESGTFEPPAFEKFTDMEQLLLLDPIHEVSDAGWPHGRKD